MNYKKFIKIEDDVLIHVCFYSLVISFFILLSCNNQKQEKQKKLRSELAILSQAISTSPNDPAHFVKRAEYFLFLFINLLRI